MENVEFPLFFQGFSVWERLPEMGGRAAENERIKGFGDGLRVENLHFCMIFQGFRARERLRGVGGSGRWKMEK